MTYITYVSLPKARLLLIIPESVLLSFKDSDELKNDTTLNGALPRVNLI